MDWRDRFTRIAIQLGPTLLIVTTFVTILLGLILHAISIDELEYGNRSAKNYDPNVIIGEDYNDLVWFLQVTDLHLSEIGSFERETDFNEFAKSYVDIVKPDVVLVTGDITDGRIPNTSFGTGSQLDEWLAYEDTVERSNALNKTVWLDIRGNHDNFNVYRPIDPKTLYRLHLIQGKDHAGNYLHILTKNGKNYTFFGVDEVQTPGLKFPFNFIGVVEDEDLNELKQFKEHSRNNNSRYHIWFAHYPTSSIASPHEGLRNIFDGPYLCGHFHTVGNWVAEMHATQQLGFVELELGDWKNNRRIRLAAIDHQLFSFIDLDFNRFPIALITNPKPARYLMPKYEPVERLLTSTHIRVIAFSNATMNAVEISIDGGELELMEHVDPNSPLYVIEWNPSNYLDDSHEIQIHVSAVEGKKVVYKQSFSFDNTKEEFPIGARIILRAYFKSYVMAIFFFIMVVCTLPMLALRLVRYKHGETSLKRHYKGTFLYNLQLLSGINRLFWPLFIIPVWLAAGPYFLGYLVDDTIGACFVWGVLIDETFIHTGMTYNVGSIYLLLIHIPVTILLTNQVSDGYISTANLNSSSVSISNTRLILQLAITVLQLCMEYILFSAYGAMAFFTSFPFLYCIIIYAYCWYQCTTIERSDFERLNKSESQEELPIITSLKSLDDDSSKSERSIR